MTSNVLRATPVTLVASIILAFTLFSTFTHAQSKEEQPNSNDAAAQLGTASADALSRSYVWWDLTARVRYTDESETNIDTSDISYSSYEVRMASRNPSEFAQYKIKQKALFDCEIISGPSGTVRVGSTPNGIALSKDKSVADLVNRLTKPDSTEKKAQATDDANLLLTRYQVYAPPLFYGQWRVVGSHIGTATFNISVEPIGSTLVVGQVRYYNRDNQRVVQSFSNSVTVRTGNSVANIEVRLKGNPTGSSCWVTVR
jgi:hypothetical protein